MIISDNFLENIAVSVLASFLHTIGIPTDGIDIDIKDYGPFRVFTAQVRVPDELAATIDSAETLDKLTTYMDHHNDLPTAVRFHAYNAEVYVCPCGCGTFLYASIYHAA